MRNQFLTWRPSPCFSPRIPHSQILFFVFLVCFSRLACPRFPCSRILDYLPVHVPDLDLEYAIWSISFQSDFPLCTCYVFNRCVNLFLIEYRSNSMSLSSDKKPNSGAGGKAIMNTISTKLGAQPELLASPPNGTEIFHFCGHGRAKKGKDKPKVIPSCCCVAVTPLLCVRSLVRCAQTEFSIFYNNVRNILGNIFTLPQWYFSYSYFVVSFVCSDLFITLETNFHCSFRNIWISKSKAPIILSIVSFFWI